MYNEDEIMLVENSDLNSPNAFFKPPTQVSPYVLIDPIKLCLILKGRSCPENPQKFYNEVFGALKQQLGKAEPNFIANINLEYYNTSTAKCLFGLFDELNFASDHGKSITVNWFYEKEDEDMLESGEDFSDMSDLEFNFIPIELI